MALHGVRWLESAGLRALRRHQNGRGLGPIEELLDRFADAAKFKHPISSIRTGDMGHNRSGMKALCFLSLGKDLDEIQISVRLDANHRVPLRLCFEISAPFVVDDVKTTIAEFNRQQDTASVSAERPTSRNDRPPLINLARRGGRTHTPHAAFAPRR